MRQQTFGYGFISKVIRKEEKKENSSGLFKDLLTTQQIYFSGSILPQKFFNEKFIVKDETTNEMYLYLYVSSSPLNRSTVFYESLEEIEPLKLPLLHYQLIEELKSGISNLYYLLSIIFKFIELKKIRFNDW